MLRLSTIQLSGPSGQQVVLQANGEGELVIEVRDQLVLIRDTGMPPHVAGSEKTPPVYRIVAQVPISWAIFPEWEIMLPPSTRTEKSNVSEINGASHG